TPEEYLRSVSSTDLITVATPLERGTYRVLRRWVSQPPDSFKRLIAIWVLTPLKPNGVGRRDYELVVRLEAESPTPRLSPDADDAYPKSVQVHGVSRLTTRCRQVYQTSPI